MSRSSDDRLSRKKALKEAALGVYRDAILAAAERVFGRAGFQDAKMTEIGREAGLAPATLYNYFDSKERIFQSLLDLRGQELIDRLETVALPERDPEKRLLAVIRAGLEWLDERRGMFRIIVELGGLPGVRRVTGQDPALPHERFLSAYERVLRDAVEAGLLRKDIPTSDQVACLLYTSPSPRDS